MMYLTLFTISLLLASTITLAAHVYKLETELDEANADYARVLLRLHSAENSDIYTYEECR